MIIKYDEKSDSIFFVLSQDKAYESEEIEKDVIVDYDKNNKITSIEVLNFKSNNKDVELPVLGDFILQKAS